MRGKVVGVLVLGLVAGCVDTVKDSMESKVMHSGDSTPDSDSTSADSTSNDSLPPDDSNDSPTDSMRDSAEDSGTDECVITDGYYTYIAYGVRPGSTCGEDLTLAILYGYATGLTLMATGESIRALPKITHPDSILSRQVCYHEV